MRKQYDFSKGVRGVHAARFREGIRIVVTDAAEESSEVDRATPSEVVGRRDRSGLQDQPKVQREDV